MVDLLRTVKKHWFVCVVQVVVTGLTFSDLLKFSEICKNYNYKLLLY